MPFPAAPPPGPPPRPPPSVPPTVAASLARIPADQLLLVFILTFGGPRLLVILLAVLVDDPVTLVAEHGLALTLLGISLQGGFLLAGLSGLRRRYGLHWRDLGFRQPPPDWAWPAIGIGVLAIVGVGLVNLAVMLLSGERIDNPQLRTLAPESFSWAAYLVTLTATCLIAPLVEETAFRGLLYGWLRGRTGAAAAALASALVFAGLHGIVVLVPALFVVGLLLVHSYGRSGSLWSAVVTHAVFNGIMTTLLFGFVARGIPLS